MRIRCARRIQAGTSLVEVVLATVLLIIMVASVIGTVTYGLFAIQLFRENQRATQIILEKVEIIRLYSWDEVNAANFIPTTFSDVYNPQSTTAPGVTYNGTLTLTNYPGSGVSYGTNVVQLVVTLQWTTADRVAHTRMLATLIAKDGIQNYVY